MLACLNVETAAHTRDSAWLHACRIASLPIELQRSNLTRRERIMSPATTTSGTVIEEILLLELQIQRAALNVPKTWIPSIQERLTVRIRASHFPL